MKDRVLGLMNWLFAVSLQRLPRRFDTSPTKQFLKARLCWRYHVCQMHPVPLCPKGS